MHAFVDADVLVYACGFASDAAAKKKAEQYGEPVEGVHEPLNFCLNGVAEKIQSVKNATGARKLTLFLSHPVNFREGLYPEYKANRDVTHKPYWAREIVDYLLEKGALYADFGDEADDAMGIAQMEAQKAGKQSIIATNDKDLDMIPGLHYNWSPSKIDRGVYEVDELEGMRHFYTQLISGDSTDNIPGIFRATGRKASAQMKNGLEFLYTEQEMYKYVLSLYDNNEEFVHMIAPLLWIKRHKGQVWSPPV